MLWATAIKKTVRAAEQERADVARKRRLWRRWQIWLKPDRLVFVDETGAKTNMTRLRGRSLKGSRLKAAIPWGHWKTTTFVAGLRTTGITAPMVLDGAMNGPAFQGLCGTAARPQPPARRHRGHGQPIKPQGRRRAPGDQGQGRVPALFATLFPRPPLHLNPIELAFSKLKALLRKAAARSVDELWRVIGDLLDEFSPQECQKFFRHAGYDR